MSEQTQTQTQTDEWGSLEVVAPQTSNKATVVPDSILALADVIIKHGSRDVVTDGWSAEKLKDFQRFLVGAAEQKGVRFRKQAMQNGGKSVLRVTVMKPNTPSTPAVPAAPAPAPEAAPEAAAPAAPKGGKK